MAQRRELRLEGVEQGTTGPAREAQQIAAQDVIRRVRPKATTDHIDDVPL